MGQDAIRDGVVVVDDRTGLAWSEMLDRRRRLTTPAAREAAPYSQSTRATEASTKPGEMQTT